MIPLLLFLLGCAAIYAGVVEAAFSVLMRLPLRLSAERHGRLEALGHFLEDPLRLFLPVRVLQGLIVALVAAIVLGVVADRSAGTLGLVGIGLVAFVVACGQLLPLLLVRRDPERVLELLLPSFQTVARLLQPITLPLIRLVNGARRDRDAAANGAGAGVQTTSHEHGREAQAEIDEREERRLLQSVVDFGDTLVREVMTPRPDIVAVRADATVAELRTVFSEQQYSRLPVYKGNLDNILGFVFVKDLVPLAGASSDERVVDRLMRPAYLVPETKRVADLLKEFQRGQVQSAIVHDEYGGTAGLVTIEDLLEEIVGEIRDEYDVETEPVVDEGNGSYVFSAKVSVDEVTEHLNVEIERHGFETVGGYLLWRLGRVPRTGEVFDVDQLNVEVLEAERRRVHRVRLRRRPRPSAAEARA